MQKLSSVYVYTPALDLFSPAKRETKRHQSYSQSVRLANTNDFIWLVWNVLTRVKFIVNMTIFFSYLIQFVFVEYCWLFHTGKFRKEVTEASFKNF